MGEKWNGSRLSDGLDPSSDPAGGSRVETSQSTILLEVGWKEVPREMRKRALRKMSIGRMKRVLQCDVFLHSVWQAWVCKHHHLGNRVMFMTFWLKVEPNWPKHSVLPPPLP